MNERENLLSLILIILGVGLILFAVKDFIISFIAGVLGYMITNYGLKLRNKPSLNDYLLNLFEDFQK